MKLSFLFILIFSFYTSFSQSSRLTGRVEDVVTGEPLADASITLYRSGIMLGGISNKEGNFSINNPEKLDSIKFSMIGYQERMYKRSEMIPGGFIKVGLRPSVSDLTMVIVHPMDVMEIVRRTAQNIPLMIPAKDFESGAFYREIIRDSQQYYSVAEAIFNLQFSVQKKSFKIKLEKGRSKEDVAYTRLFEDFHPGGGPEDAVSQSLVVRRPDFLNEGSFKNYIYKKDSTIRRDGQLIYVVGFDQKPNLKEALEKGRIFIDANDFSILKFDAENSPVGTPYIKSLKGTDKIFAELLHIDLTLKKWTRTASYTKIGDKLFLSYAKMEYDLGFKQPKKGIDLGLLINTELVVTDFQHPLINEISRGEEWKRKNLVANLPADFDADFWGTYNIVSPTSEINTIIASISKKNQDVLASQTPAGWQYLNKGYFTAAKTEDGIRLIPLVKSVWEDNKTGGMIYKNMEGDFNIEAKLSITKRSSDREIPDNGFQQTGIILRSEAGKEENNLIFSMGTGGNDIPKYFLKRTTNGKTKWVVNKTDSLTAWLRLEKRGKMVSAYKKPDEKSRWTKVETYSLDWLNGELQVGLSVMAKFTGDGPKQHQDMKAVLSNIKIDRP